MGRRPVPWLPSLSPSFLSLGFAPRDSVRVQGDTARRTPQLQPFPGAGSAPALHLPTPEPLLRDLRDPLGSGPPGLRPSAPRGRARIPCPCRGQSGTMRAFLFVLSLVTRVGIQSQERASPKSPCASSVGVMGRRAGGTVTSPPRLPSTSQPSGRSATRWQRSCPGR